VEAALRAMECLVVQDLFLNETAKFAHVFLPGASFLEKDGTFTNAERRISRVRKVMPPLAGKADWEVTQMLSNALGYPMHYNHPSEIMDEIARLTPTFHGVSYERAGRAGQHPVAVQRSAPDGTPIMHVDEFVRGKGRFMLTEYVPTTEASPEALPADAHHRPHPQPVQRRRPDPAHRQHRLARRGPAGHPSGGRRGPRHRDGDWVGMPAAPATPCCAPACQRAHAAGGGLHHLPLARLRRQRDHHRQLRLGHQLPRIQGDRRACGLCGVDSLGQVAREVARVSARPLIDGRAIHRAFAALSEGQALHALTGSVHAAGWATSDGTLLAVREDVGRHNALDKLIGAIVRAGIDPAQGFAVVTSRASYEMVLKLASVGGGLLAAISAPTGLAIDLAARTGVTLCGFVRDGRMAIYTESRASDPTRTE
jgi:formate dehydrogenase accessory protein FdhD